MNAADQFARGRASPGLRYRDVGTAAEWLCNAFGFEKHSVVADVNGCVSYAELSFGNSIIMLGAVRGFEIDNFMAQPKDIGGFETQCCYFAVSDLDAHYLKARAGGCEIAIDIKTQANGERAYTCRDPEGHLWTFGTYDPWVEAGIAADAHRGSTYFPRHLAMGLSIAAIGAVFAAAWVYGESWRPSPEAVAAPAVSIGPELMIGERLSKEAQRAIREARRRLSLERIARRAAERASIEAREEAARERSLRVSAEQAAKELAERLAFVQRAKDLAQSAASSAKNQPAEGRSSEPADNVRLFRETERALAVERSAKEQAERSAAKAHAQLSDAKTATAAAEKAALDARNRLTFVAQSAKEGAEQAIVEIRKQVINEQAARAAAERAAGEARDELARERSSKQAAWRTVEQLKKRLAMVEGNPQPAEKASAGNAVPAVKKAKAVVVPKTTVQPSSPTMGGDDWSLYRGPSF